MRTKLLKLAAAAVALALCVPAAGPARAAGDGTMIRVGLASSSTHNALGELASAHLENASGHGAGYRFGYYDEDLSFVEVGRTDDQVTKVAVLKTQNLSYGRVSSLNKYTYSDEIDTDLKVGCVHIRMPGEYGSFEEAEAAAERYDGGFPAWIDGTYQVRVGAYTSGDDARAAIEALGEGEVAGTSAYGFTVVKTGTDHVLFQYDDSSGGAFGVMPDVTGSRDARTWFSGFHYRGGFQYQRLSGDNITVVNVLPLEDYVKGVVCYEMGREWPLEALKTQAVCARTYVLRRIGYHDARGFDVCNSASCQVYYGTGSDRSDFGPSGTSDRAVEETAGQVLRYKGTLAETYYSSCHGGASEDAKYIWGTDTTNEYPYLCGVIDPYEQAVNDRNPYNPWTVRYTAAQLQSRIQSYGYGTKTSLDHLELTYSKLGNVIQVKFCYTNGQSNTITPRNSPGIRSILNVLSIRFTVNGQTVSGEASQPQQNKPSSGSAGGWPLAGGGTLSRPEDAYVISGSGKVSAAPEDKDLYAVAGTGKTEVLGGTAAPEEEEEPGSNEGGGTVSVYGDTYVLTGGGNGHQVGMSQFGANAMARQGFSYDEILTFYYPGTQVGSY